MNVVAKEYDAKIDAKKRITLRGASYDYYHITEFPNGEIRLEPRELRPPFQISENTLNMMDISMQNLKNGEVSETIDLSDFN